jgi:TonB-linked outer membrane protein, SusC/RagA family
MKPTIILCIILLVAGSTGFAQRNVFSISEDNVPFRKIMRLVERSSKYSFAYIRENLPLQARVSVHVEKGSLHEVMMQALRGLYYQYELMGDSMIVVKPAKTALQYKTSLIVVKGKVLNEDGLPLEGVSVWVQKSSKGTSTNGNGEFMIPGIHPEAVLYFSCIGYQPEYLPIQHQSYIELHLKAAAVKSMDETVIIAYGRTSKRLNTGSVHKITHSEITRQPVSNPLAALQANVPGLLITQRNGLPGSAYKVQLRGQSSIGITPGKLPPNDPLFIIDGVPFAPNNTPFQIIASGTALGSQGRSPFSVINPADIESMEVLKDADATAIYGSRGANGVVLITTRKGKPGKPLINVNVYSGASRITRHIDMLDTRQYVAMRLRALQNDGLAVNENTAPDLTVWDTTRYTNFKDMLIGNTAKLSNVQLSASGGNARLSYLIGTGYSHETTVFPGKLADNRASMHMHLQHNSANNKFAADLSLLYAYDKNTSIIKDLTQLIDLTPNLPAMFDSAGNLNWQQGNKTFVNPMAFLQQPYEANTGNVLTGLDLKYRINSHLSLKANLGYNAVAADELSLIPRSSQNTYIDPNAQGISYFGHTLYESYIAEPQLEYTTFIRKSKLSFLTGATYQRTINTITNITATGFNSDEFLRNVHEASNLDSNEINNDYRYAALFARFNYMLNNTYILNLTARRDGSSRFGPSKRFGNFGAIGAAWIFSNEPFMKKLLPFIGLGKIRSSYGITGNDRIGDYKYLDRWKIVPNNYLGSIGIYPTQLADSNYRWEVSHKMEVAIELGLLNDRIQFTAAYYRNRNSNQLIAYPLPSITGFSKYEAKNSGAVVQNTGLELMLRVQSKAEKKLEWMHTVSLTVPKNKLLAFPQLIYSAYVNNLLIGQSLSVIQGYHYTGIDNDNLLFDFEDKDSDDIISYPGDYGVIGNLDPTWYGSVQNSLQYKNWQLNLFWEVRSQKANSYVNSVYLQGQPGIVWLNQPITVFDNTFQSFSTGANFKVLEAIETYLNSDGVLANASYVRLRNIALSWSIPKKWQQKLSLKNCRFYLQAQNLLTFTSFYGLDPETQKIETLPPLKTITGGVELSF